MEEKSVTRNIIREMNKTAEGKRVYGKGYHAGADRQKQVFAEELKRLEAARINETAPGFFSKILAKVTHE